MYPVLAAAVVLIYNLQPAPEFPQDRNPPNLVLDRQSLVEIYDGTIQRWNDPKLKSLNPEWAVHLPDSAITVVHRSDSSGTTELFTRSLAAFSPDWTAGSAPSIEWPVDQSGAGVGAKGNQGVAEVVTNTVNSLGYVELSYAVSNSLIYADMLNRAGKRVRANAESLTAAIDEFGPQAFDDRLTATIVDGEQAGSWPLAGFTYLILHTSGMTDCLKARKLLEFIHWTLTDPSALARAAQLGYAVVPDAVREEVIVKLGEVTCNGEAVMR
jgi:phosphate transport system substrate-binding protein